MTGKLPAEVERRVRRLWLSIVITGVSVATHWLLFQRREIVPGVTARPLGPCDVQYHAKWRATVLACPGTDLIKVWPLPIVQPWYEDPFADKRTVEDNRSLTLPRHDGFQTRAAPYYRRQLLLLVASGRTAPGLSSDRALLG